MHALKICALIMAHMKAKKAPRTHTLMHALKICALIMAHMKAKKALRDTRAEAAATTVL